MIEGAPILVADDSSDDIELLKRALRRAGLNNPVQCVSNGNEAIEYLKLEAKFSECGTGCPLLMFLDLKMPGCTGFGVLDWLRTQPHLRRLPTIVFSNSEQQSDIDDSFRLGAQGYWVKPSRFEDLVSMMVRLKDILGNVTRRLETSSAASVAA